MVVLLYISAYQSCGFKDTHIISWKYVGLFGHRGRFHWKLCSAECFIWITLDNSIQWRYTTTRQSTVQMMVNGVIYFIPKLCSIGQKRKRGLHFKSTFLPRIQLQAADLSHNVVYQINISWFPSLTLIHTLPLHRTLYKYLITPYVAFWLKFCPYMKRFRWKNQVRIISMMILKNVENSFPHTLFSISHFLFLRVQDGSECSSRYPFYTVLFVYFRDTILHPRWAQMLVLFHSLTFLVDHPSFFEIQQLEHLYFSILA